MSFYQYQPTCNKHWSVFIIITEYLEVPFCVLNSGNWCILILLIQFIYMTIRVAGCFDSRRSCSSNPFTFHKDFRVWFSGPGRIKVWADSAPGPPFWQLNHANSAYFGAISANFPSISTVGPLFLQIPGPALPGPNSYMDCTLVFQSLTKI